MSSKRAETAGRSATGPRAASAAAEATSRTVGASAASTAVTASGSRPSSRVAALAGPVTAPSAAACAVAGGSSPAAAAAAPNAMGWCGPSGCSAERLVQAGMRPAGPGRPHQLAPEPARRAALRGRGRAGVVFVVESSGRIARVPARLVAAANAAEVRPTLVSRPSRKACSVAASRDASGGDRGLQPAGVGVRPGRQAAVGEQEQRDQVMAHQNRKYRWAMGSTSAGAGSTDVAVDPHREGVRIDLDPGQRGVLRQVGLGQAPDIALLDEAPPHVQAFGQARPRSAAPATKARLVAGAAAP